MNLQEIRSLLRDNTSEYYDPYYEILNKAWKSLPPNNLDSEPVKAGNYSIRLVAVGLSVSDPEQSVEDNTSAWEAYHDAFCTAEFLIVETGDRFEVSGENGSWGWGFLMETDLSQIRKIS